MTDRLKAFFEEALLPADDADEYERAVGIQCATAVLLIAVSKADSEQDDLERAVIKAMLQDTFDLDDEMLDRIVEFADEATAEADGVDQFTSMINENYGYADKKKLLEYLWVVALADGRLDRYEEQFIAKVAGLLDVLEEDSMAAKAAAEDSAF
jgi:uncharacterized tellurite resistance protein B-like protein